MNEAMQWPARLTSAAVLVRVGVLAGADRRSIETSAARARG
ncbi:hypothetical protein [Salinispora fenicalii]|nr:hypothetical protein [Salinispora fenicalii]